jgi:4-hydroxy-tetrahydrodipicolinate reductase
MGQGDVIIDFTFHEATMKIARQAAQNNRAMVIGTTGLSQENLQELAELCKNMPCVQAPNMAVGVNVLFKMAAKVASILGNDYDMEIVEAHHRMKKDAPSGTAMKLGEVMAEAVGRDLDKDGVGDIVGEHTVYFAGAGERLELTHRAHSRDNFARGAALAAAWVVNQPNGLYNMFDVLGLQDL